LAGSTRPAGSVTGPSPARWAGGQATGLTLTTADGVVIARGDPGGLVTIPAKLYIVIPSALRRRCGLLPGDRVLLAMFPGQDAMAAYSFAVVDEALLCHGLFAQLRVAEGLAMAGVPAQLAAAYLCLDVPFAFDALGEPA
jgi:hypothetical protein